MRLLGPIFLSLTRKREVLNVKMFIPFQAGHRHEKNQMLHGLQMPGVLAIQLAATVCSPRAGVNY